MPWLRALLFLLFTSFAFALTPAERVASFMNPARGALESTWTGKGSNLGQRSARRFVRQWHTDPVSCAAAMRGVTRLRLWFAGLSGD